MAASDTRFYVSLEAIRGLAAIMVAMRHFPGVMVNAFPTDVSYLAVDAFFLLSGFVLASSYEARIRAGTISTGAFLKSRLIRLWPVYALGSVIGLAGLLAFDPPTTPELLAIAGTAPFFLPAFLPGHEWFPLDAPAWSLFFELLMSAAYVLVVARLDNRRLAMTMLVCGIGFAVGIVEHGSADFGWQSPALQLFAVFRIGFSFCLGVLIFRNREALARRFMPSGNRGLVVIAATTIVLLALPVPRDGPAATGYDILCIAGLFPLLICFAIRCRPSGRLARAGLALGALSYPLYAMHEPILRLIEPLAIPAFLPVTVVPAVASALLAALAAIAYLTAVVYDLPVRRALHRRLDSRRPLGPHPATDASRG